MNIVDRVKKICLTPASEWSVIAQESASTSELLTGYVVPLAAIGAVAGFIGGSLIGYTVPFLGTIRVPVMSGLTTAVLSVVAAACGVFVISLIINALAPTFGAEKNSSQAMKVAVYSTTPGMVAGIFQIIPALGLLVLIGVLYAWYVLYLGLPRLMKAPQDKAVGYTAAVIICAIVLFFTVSVVVGSVIGIGVMGQNALTGALGGAAPTAAQSEPQYDRDSAMGRLQELGKKLEESGRKMEDAERKGDQGAQAAAAIEGLGTLFGGGRRVEPVSLDQLKPFVPETFLGLPRTSNNAERTGIAGLMVAKVESTYSDGGEKSVDVEVTDTGGVSGLTALAGWVEGERENDEGSERTAKVGGRLVHEKTSNRGGTNEFAVVLGDRFIVSAKGRGVDLAQLKAEVSRFDLARLESMKDAGVQK